MSRSGSVDGRARPRGWRAPMLAAVAMAIASAWLGARVHTQPEQRDSRARVDLRIELDEASGVLAVRRAGDRVPIVTQHAPPDRRPYLHPIAAPDGQGWSPSSVPRTTSTRPASTGASPASTAATTSTTPAGDYWRRVSATVTQPAATRSDGRPSTTCSTQAAHDHPDRDRSAGRCASGTARSCSIWNGGARPGPTSQSASTTTAGCSCGCPGARACRRSRQRGAAARRARRRPARDVDRRRHAGRGPRRPGARRDLRSSRQRRLSAGLASRWAVRRRLGAVARGRLDDQEGRDRSRPPPARASTPERSTTSS